MNTPIETSSGAVSADRNRQALRSSERLVAVEMGVNPDDNAGLTRAQRIEFNHRLAEKILQYAGNFTPGTLETARRVVLKQYEPLADDGFSATDFAAAALKPAGDALQSVGNGVLTTLNAAKWAIPLAAAGVAVVLFLAFRKKVQA